MFWFLALAGLHSADAGPRTNRANATPGAVFVVREKMSSVTPMGKEELAYLPIFREPGGIFDGATAARPGDRLEVLIKPKKYDGINCIKVRHVPTSTEGFVFWTHFLHSTYFVEPESCEKSLEND